jgi:hypothetical protein
MKRNIEKAVHAGTGTTPRIARLTPAARLRAALAALALGLAGCTPAFEQIEPAGSLGSQEGATVSNTEVRSVSAGKCLATEGASTANGVRSVIWTCNGSSAQQWTIPSVGFIGEVKLSSGRCLDVLNNATANGSAVGIWDCTGGNNQKWERTSADQLRSVSANRCLDVYGKNTADGTYNIIYDCNGQTNQKWTQGTSSSDQPLGGGTGWTKTFEDSFNGTSLDMNTWMDHESWESGGYGAGDWGWIRVPTPSTNLAVANGSVALKVRREAGLPTWTRSDGTVVQRTHTTAHISTKNKQVVPANTVSYIEARMKAPDNNCTLPSLWLLGNGTWSTTGEVDILEFFNNATEKGMPAFTVHYPRDVWTNPPGTAFNDVWVTHSNTLVTRSDLPNTWHTWGLYRDSTRMELRIDGTLIATFEPNKSYPTWDNHNIRLPPMLFTNDMNIRLSYGVGGHQSAGLTNSQCVDGDFLIDYVKVWRK